MEEKTIFETCQFCGHVISISTYIYLSLNYMKLEAIARCECSDARIERERLKQLKSARDSVQEMFKSIAEERVLLLLQEACLLIIYGHMEKATVKINEVVEAKIT